MAKKASPSSKKTAVNHQPSFEKALERLEDIVAKLEGAEAPLEKALALYEEGVGLARFCSQQLKAAERKVELLEDKNNDLRGRAFSHESAAVSINPDIKEEDAHEEDDDEEDEGEEGGSETEDEDDDEEEGGEEKNGDFQGEKSHTQKDLF